MRAAPLILVALQGVSAFGGNALMNYFRIQAMNKRFKEDQLDQAQQNALMKQSSDNIGDMQLFISDQMTASEFKGSLKQQMKDNLLNSMISSNSVDINNPLWQKLFFGSFDKEKVYRLFGEPMATIMRLMQSTRTTEKDEGKRLMKRYQYKKFNRQGNAISENIEYLLADDKKSRQDKMKELLNEQILRSFQDPLDRAIVHTMRKYKDETDATKKADFKTQLSDLQKVKILTPSVPKNSVINSDDLFSFFKLTKAEVKPSTILGLALNDSYTPLNKLDFEHYFGSSAKQFSCRAHAANIRVPCMVAPSAQECIENGCCYDPNTADAPACYMDVYGNIEMGLLRSAFIESSAERSKAISDLFNGGTIPTLDYILQDETPRGAKFSDEMSNNRDNIMRGATGDFNINEGSTMNWWEAAKVEYEQGPNGEDMNLNAWGTGGIHDGKPGYQRPYTKKWQPHAGPTQSPYFGRLPGVNPTANPTGTGGLDEFYQLWLSYAAQQDEAECALIPQQSRVKCMENFEAIQDKLDNTNLCRNAGCCYNEDSFLSGGHACYRARDYGTCNNFPDNFFKRPCFDGDVSEAECLSNAACCYKPTRFVEQFGGTPNVQHKAEPWCFYKYSATLEEDQWCDAYMTLENQGKIRDPCFDTSGQKFMKFDDSSADPFFNSASDFNNVVGEQACLEAGCCYDPNLSRDIREWAVNGLGQQNSNTIRCFRKRNPALARDAAWGQYQGEDSGLINVLIDHNVEGSDPNAQGATNLRNPREQTLVPKTCRQADWDQNIHVFKRDCGNLSYKECVHVRGCCFQPTALNVPHCYHPEYKLVPP